MLSWLKVRERFEASLLNLTRNIVITKLPNVLYQELCFSSDEHNYETRHATEGRFKLPKVKTNHGKRTVKYRSMSTWNNLPSEIINANSKNISLKSSRKGTFFYFSSIQEEKIVFL